MIMEFANIMTDELLIALWKFILFWDDCMHLLHSDNWLAIYHLPWLNGQNLIFPILHEFLVLIVLHA